MKAHRTKHRLVGEHGEFCEVAYGTRDAYRKYRVYDEKLGFLQVDHICIENRFGPNIDAYPLAPFPFEL